MDLAEFILVGKTLKPHGLKGEINIIFQFPIKKGKAAELKTLFLGKPPNTLPYFIENLKQGTEKFIIKFEDINSRDQALSLSNKDIYSTKDTFEELYESLVETINYEGLIGFGISNEDNILLGKIEDILELPQQTLAQINYKNREALIPLNEDTIIRLDEKKKVLQVKLPDGLLDIYTE